MNTLGGAERRIQNVALRDNKENLYEDFAKSHAQRDLYRYAHFSKGTSSQGNQAARKVGVS